MICGLSGAVCQEPVVNIKTGHVYEKRLIEEHIKTHGNVCPLSETPLTLEDLLPLKLSTLATDMAPPSKATSSIPSLLSALQTEYDAHALEMFQVKKHLQQTRQELSHALYQYDAACRVIARLNREIEQLKERNQTPQVADAVQDPWDAVSAHVAARAKELAHYRKKERRVEEITKNVAAMNSTATHTLHQSDKPGVLALDIKEHRIITGGNDKDAKIFNTQSGQIEATLSGHSKKVTDVLFHPNADVAFTASADKTVKLWSAGSSERNYTLGHTFSGHEGSITSMSLHPTGSYLGTSSEDGAWGFFDLGTATLLKKVAAKASEMLALQFHPDGAIFATAQSDSTIRVWDVASANEVAKFEGHTKAVTALSFSENGYHLASGSADGLVKFWDLRKLKSVIDLQQDAPVHAVNFEFNGSYLGVASNKAVTIYKESGKKNWDIVKTFADHQGNVTDVKLARGLEFIASTSLDRSLKIYA
ncbi:pre-mRNA-processing factor 19 [Thraustotheca clavata]|uniref:Pre-mRNA-processing factor 19 n=1 Tax=Thraustotheca clavata TaxID=74557 RepID=A0A1W0A1N1_9STRA|nr:pre-mRNA-processing factor 19 [Thraustotheca clavata]